MNNTRHMVSALAICCTVACAGADPTESRSDGVEGPVERPDEAVGARLASSEQVAGTHGEVLGGSCARPIEIRRAGVRFGAGSSTVMHGTTEGMSDELHPYGRRLAADAGEVVFSYRVPAGTEAVRVSTSGATFDTVLYVRSGCAQHDEGEDLGFNDNAYDQGQMSAVYLTHLTPGQVIFIVVDGNAAQGPARGRFDLTVRDLPFGQQGTPCVPGEVARCSNGLRCSEGATADGADLCLPTIALGRGCDPRGFRSTCEEGAICAIDSASPEAMLVGPVCRPAR